jgi:hypothetical protein
MAISKTRGWRARHDKIAHQPEETGKAQVGDDNHHAEQKRDGVEIDRPISLIERDDAHSDHEAGADERRAGAVELITGKLADGDDEISREKNDNGRGRSSAAPGDVAR